ncbi:MAG: ATP-binding protein [Acidobacteria bacterium]|nr:ATP-binding protein [Acidobacteriota bacterium]MCI0623022.1 ATP-binding protein [Acidobacteriota bacterium]MCI0717470.1 ATP-binding protein [Acidobacteriota bacterium]
MKRAVTFRTKLLLAFVLTVATAVGLVSWVVSATTQGVFEALDEQHTRALVDQFRRELASRSADVTQQVERVAASESLRRLAVDLAGPLADISPYLDTARELSASHALDFLDLVDHDGTLVSSAHWPARFGYKETWLIPGVSWDQEAAFLRKIEQPEGLTLGLVAVRSVAAGDRKLWVVGGKKLSREFLARLPMPAGMRTLLYSNLEPTFSFQALISASGPLPQAGVLAPLIEEVRQQRRETTRTVTWSGDPSSAEVVHAIPLLGRERELLAILLLGSSRRDLVLLTRFIRRLGIIVGGGGVLLGVLIAWWTTHQVTRPVRRLAEGARRVAAGRWDTQVQAGSSDEIGQLARAFNQMIRQLAEQRERLIQAERVAAWRELARRLAHELKNPLFPLQITVENMERARQHHPEQFDEVFREGAAALKVELSNLKGIVGRFSDFSKMPAPQMEPVHLNELICQVLRLFDARFCAGESAIIQAESFLDEGLVPVLADPEQIRRALQNLILNALDAMPSGGTLTVRTSQLKEGVQIEVSDTGTGLTPEECERLFTPYYTTKQHGTGLGLAIVQSVVSDHEGRISVESHPGKGTTFRITLAAVPRGIV